MKLSLRKLHDICIVDVKDDVDLYNAHELKELVNKLGDKQVRKLIINMEQVEYIDSSGIGSLIHIYTLYKKEPRQLRIVNVHGSVEKVIKLTKLMEYFPIVNELSDAISQLK